MIDVLVLGPFIFTDFSVPERMPYGGRQNTVVHKMPGGMRTVDAMGPDDGDRIWRGILWGDSAYSDMLLLDTLRRQGAELPFSNGLEARTAIITDFKPEMEKFTCVHYEIAIVLTDDVGAGLVGAATSLTSLVTSDLSAALAL